MAFSHGPCYARLMQITVDIPDQLAEQIRARGLTPEGFVRSLIDEAERNAPPVPDPTQPKLDMEAFFKGMAAYSEKIPQLPDEAFTRESFYQDHD
jgi:hypothetical protein